MVTSPLIAPVDLLVPPHPADAMRRALAAIETARNKVLSIVLRPHRTACHTSKQSSQELLIRAGRDRARLRLAYLAQTRFRFAEDRCIPCKAKAGPKRFSMPAHGSGPVGLGFVPAVS